MSPSIVMKDSIEGLTETIRSLWADEALKEYAMGLPTFATNDSALGYYQ